jgi:hypothetical protein
VKAAAAARRQEEPMADPRPALELCAGAYRAQQVSGSVILFADGVHPTSGFQAFLTFESPDLNRPRFALWHLRPTGPVLQVATPYGVTTSFQTAHAVDRVVVRDATGTHEVVVQPAEATNHGH